MDAGLKERVTPALVLDRATSLLRRASAEQWMRGVGASLPLAAVVLALYFFEHVLGVAAPLPLFALLCTLGVWLRFHMLSGLARELRLSLAPGQAAARPPALGLGELKTAMIAGLELWLWALGLLLLAQRSSLLLFWGLPLMAVRGALAPSLLARAGCAQGSGWSAVLRACADTHGVRGLFAGVELLSVFGVLVLFGNLYALLALVLLVASTVLGLDVGFVSALVAPDNELVLLLLLGVAAQAMEPLRAAVSAVAFHDACERGQGADLQAAIGQLEQRRSARPRRSATLRTLVPIVWLAASAGAANSARAQPRSQLSGAQALDAQARERARTILARPEFLDSGAASTTWQGWFDRLAQRQSRDDRDVTSPPRFEVNVPPRVLILSALGLMALAFSWWLRGALRDGRRAATLPAAQMHALIVRETAPPSDCLAAAARLASQGAYDAALRGLYAGCLQRLGWVQPESNHAARTNGQLLELLAPGPLRRAFELLTALFERTWYGRRPASLADYEEAHALASNILQRADVPPMAATQGGESGV